MNKAIKGIFIVFAAVFILVSATEAVFRSSASVTGNNLATINSLAPVCPSVPGPGFCLAGEDAIVIAGNDTNGCPVYACESRHEDITLNEIYPNPAGDEAAALPGGEWVEIFNKGDWPIDVNGWYLYDAIDSHKLLISASNVEGGSTVISAKGRLIIYRNSDPLFSLNNSGSETVRLYDGVMGGGVLIDSMTYFDTHEGKSWSRLLEGTGIWTDWHVPTPGGSNV